MSGTIAGDMVFAMQAVIRVVRLSALASLVVAARSGQRVCTASGPAASIPSTEERRT
jgi:hypothetical protein